MNKKEPFPSEKKPSDKPWIYYAGLGTQMMITILAGTAIGYALETWLPNHTWPYTMILTLLFTLISLFQVIRELLQQSK